MQVGDGHAEIAFEVGERAVDVDARVGRVVAVHTGMGEPQNRLRLMFQSRALASHLPNWPSLTCPGVQSISPFSSTMRSRNLVTATNQADRARWISGEPQRQQCG